MVSCQDVSSNGMSLNSNRIHKTSVLVMDGDVLQIASRSESHVTRTYALTESFDAEFECRHMIKRPEQKQHVFDPTPPPHASSRTKVS